MIESAQHRGLVLCSPWLSTADPSTYPEGSWTDPANKDDIITLDFLRHGIKACGPTAAASELESSKLSTLGPAFITFGGKERLKDLILRFSDFFPGSRIIELKDGLHNWLVKKELAPPARAVQSQRTEHVKALTTWMNDLVNVKADKKAAQSTGHLKGGLNIYDS